MTQTYVFAPRFQARKHWVSRKNYAPGLTRKALYVTLATQSQLIKKNTMKTEWIVRLKALANANYAKGYGWQVLVECYGTNDWVDLVGRCETWADALTLMIRTAEIQTDRYNDANAEIL